APFLPEAGGLCCAGWAIAAGNDNHIRSAALVLQGQDWLRKEHCGKPEQNSAGQNDKQHHTIRRSGVSASRVRPADAASARSADRRWRCSSILTTIMNS